MFQLGYVEGVRATKAAEEAAQRQMNGGSGASGGVPMTRSARQRRDREAYQKKTDAMLTRFVKTNAAKLGEFVPTATTAGPSNPFLDSSKLPGASGDTMVGAAPAAAAAAAAVTHSSSAPPPLSVEAAVALARAHADSAYGGDVENMLTKFEHRKVVAKNKSSSQMRQNIAPTVRQEVPESLKRTYPDLYLGGYDTQRNRYDARIQRLFQQPMADYLQTTTAGAGTEFRRSKHGPNPFCSPGFQGRTNLSGWGDAVGSKPPFLRGSAFAQAHEHF